MLQNPRCPLVSTFAKQLSVILLRSSSKRSARVRLPERVVDPLVDDGPLGPPGGRLELPVDPLGESRDRPKDIFILAHSGFRASLLFGRTAVRAEWMTANAAVHADEVFPALLAMKEN